MEQSKIFALLGLIGIVVLIGYAAFSLLPTVIVLATNSIYLVAFALVIALVVYIMVRLIKVITR